MGVDTRASASWERLASIVPQRLGGRSDTNITGRMELSKWGGGVKEGTVSFGSLDRSMDSDKRSKKLARQPGGDCYVVARCVGGA